MGIAPTLAAAPAAHATTGFAFTRIFGANRFSTAAAVAKQAFPNGAQTVLLATGFNFPDSLAGNYLAGIENPAGNPPGAPILLTNVDSLPAETSGALSSLGAKNVIILGQTAAVSQAVQNQLVAAGYNVTRIGGATRYDTMQQIDEVSGTGTQTGQAGTGTGVGGAEIGQYNGGGNTALLARGDNFPDALGAGPIAYDDHFPVILTDPYTLSPQALKVIQDDHITQIIVLGGTAAISQAVENSANAAGARTIYRANGANRSDTSRLLADFAITNLGFSNTQFTVASGDQYYNGADALASGPFSGNLDIPTLVTNAVGDAGADVTFYQEHYSTETSGYAIGGPVPLPDSTLAQITGATPPSNQAYTFSPAYGTSQNVPNGNTVTYTVSGLGTSPVDIAIYNCNQVQNNNGTLTFPNSSNPGSSTGNAAPQPATGPQILTVNGTPTSGTGATATNATPTNGSVTFSYTDANQCTIPVVFQRGTGSSADTLFLGSNNSPTAPYGAGGQTTFIPGAAPAGAINGSTSTPVTAATTTYFVQNGGTYQYKPTDQYQLFNTAANACQSTTYQDFQNRLTAGDYVTGFYTPTGTSTFCLNDVAPAPPSSVTASTTASGGVNVTFNSSTSSPNVVSYTVYRAAAVAPTITGQPYTCPAVGGTPNASPQTPPASPYTAIASVPAQTSSGTYSTSSGTSYSFNGTNYTYNDSTATAGTGTSPNQYCYAVASVSPNAAGGTQTGTGQAANTSTLAPNGAPVAGTNAPPAAGAPMFASATASTANNVTTSTGTTGIVTVTYNQAIVCSTVDPNGSDYTVSSTNPTTGVVTALTVTGAACNAPTSGQSSTVNITVAGGLTAGQTIVVRAKNGTDGSTVANSAGQTQPTTDAVQTTSA